MSEDDVLVRVLDEARFAGWLTMHVRPARTRDGRWRTPVQGDGKGFPDLVLVHPARGLLAFVELKGSGGRPTVEQRVWLEALGAAAHGLERVTVGLVTPAGLEAFCDWLHGDA